MRTCQQLRRAWQAAGLIVGVVVFSGTGTLPSYAEGNHRVVGVTSIASTVPDVSGDVAQQLFITALVKTDRFTVRPPDVSGSFPGVEYVFEPTITEGKAAGSGNKKVFGFLKEAITSEAPVSMDIRVFETRTNSLVGVITAKSSDVKSDNSNAAAVQSLLGATMGGETTQPSSSNPTMGKVEERLGPIVNYAASQLVARYGGSGVQGVTQSSGLPWRR